MNAFKDFSRASTLALDAFLDQMDDETKAKVVALFDVGNALSISHVIQPDGASTILLETVLADGTHRVIASVCGQFPTTH